MRTTDILRLSTRMFRTRPSRTWLTILGISVGISAVLFLVSLGYGLQNIILQKIVFNEALLSLTVTPSNSFITINDAKVADVKTIPDVQDVAPLAHSTAQVKYGNLNSSVDIYGADSKFFDYSGVAPLAGAIYKDGEQKVLVTDALVKIFGLTANQEIVGKSIEIKIKPPNASATSTEPDMLGDYIVAGVVQNAQAGAVYLPLSEYKKYLPGSDYEQMMVKVDDSKNLQSVKDALIAKGFLIQSLSDTIDQANKIFQVIQIVLGLFGAVALVVSSIGMFNTMTVTLLERTNEIGTMRALGASRSAIRSLFLSEATVIGFLGGVVGIVLGVLAGEVFNLAIDSLAVHFGGTPISLFVYPRWFLIAILCISVFIGFFSGWFPARRAAKMDPLDALRYK